VDSEVDIVAASKKDIGGRVVIAFAELGLSSPKHDVMVIRKLKMYE
jgi:hypothetical protein